MSDSAYSLFRAASDLEAEGNHERAEAMRALAALAPMIRSAALYPDQSPDSRGIVVLKRAASAPRWPGLAVGNTVTVLDDQQWLWLATITSVLPADPAATGYETAESAQAVVVGDKLASPTPPVREDTEGPTIVLPNLSGSAHFRSWRRGDIVRIGLGTWKVSHEPITSGDGTAKRYRLVAVSAEEFESRPGRVKMGSEADARRVVGSAIKTPSLEWLKVAKVDFIETRAQFRSKTWYAVGKHVSPLVAAQTNEIAPGPLSAALHAVLPIAERVTSTMPADSAVLIPRDETSRAATGERVAMSDGAILFELAGDPDMSDSWRHYVVRISNEALTKRVVAFIRKNKRKPST